MATDKLYKSDERPYISPVVNLRQFLEEATASEERMRNFFTAAPAPTPNLFVKLERGESEAGPSTSTDQGNDQLLDSRGEFRKFMLRNNCSAEEADAAVSNGDGILASLFEKFPIGEYEITFPPKDSQLMTHKVLHDIRETIQTSSVKNALVNRGKYFKYREQELKRHYTLHKMRPSKDIVLTVHLLKPTNRTLETFEYHTLKQSCEVKMMVRGDMPLIKLREKIFCASDFWPNLEDFADLSDPSNYFANKFPSNFLFIHDTFYVDMRRPNAIDITEPIREFINRKRKDFDDYKVVDMSTVRVIDLVLRLGQPYLYQHQGRCEHLLIFTDLRLLNAGDLQNLNDYPIRLYDSIQQKACAICSNSVAGFVVVESDRVPFTPAFFCAKCFRNFHYLDGQRVGQFRAYHFLSHAGTE